MAWNNKIRSRRDGLQRAKHSWFCLDCKTHHQVKQPQSKCCGKKLLHFASKVEFDRFVELRMLQNAGYISDLKTQVKYPLDVNGTHITNYIIDYQYTDDKGRVVIEDVKNSAGVMEERAELKAKLFAALYPQFLFIIHKKR